MVRRVLLSVGERDEVEEGPPAVALFVAEAVVRGQLFQVHWRLAGQLIQPHYLGLHERAFPPQLARSLPLGEDEAAVG